MGFRERNESCRIPGRAVALIVAVAAAGVAVASVVGYRWLTPGAPNIGTVALAGSAKRISELVAQNDAAYVRALWIDFGLILGYGCALTAGNALAWCLSFTPAARRLSRAALVATGLVVLSGVGENVMLLRALDGMDGDGFPVAAQAFAFTKWSLGIPAAVVAAVGVGATMWRAIRRVGPPPPAVVCPTVESDPELCSDQAGGPGTQRTAWRANSRLPQARRGDPRVAEGAAQPEGAAGIGMCVSGGGIRAAAITFGALDALRDVLTRARWLVAVGGGGYAAGAMQLALQPPAPRDRESGWQPAAQVADVYRSGSAELDHTRRHGRYLADGTREWLVFSLTVLRGLLVNVVTLGLLVVLLGRLLAHVYAAIAAGPVNWNAWSPPPGVQWAMGVLVVAWLLLWTLAVLGESARRPVTRALRAAGVVALVVAAFVGLAGVGLPLLASAANVRPSDPVVMGSPAVSLIGGYLAALIALGKQSPVRDALSTATTRGRAWWQAAGAGSRRLMATIGVYAGLLALLSGFVMLFAVVFANTGSMLETSIWPGDVPEWVLTLGIAGVLGMLAAVDQVRWGLHPFYRQRLASAFAVRPLRKGGQRKAEPYDFDTETTSLHSYASRLDSFPEVIFSCVAHVSGQHVAPPGRRVVPWILAGEHVGGPKHGWVATDELHGYVSPTLQEDLTVQAAQAISGGVLASQMGVQQLVYAKFLALANLRLGSWLPNPRYLGQISASPGQYWALPRLPRRRRLTTLLRELVGAFPVNGPLVYVTDGGHYENLGLVELLRHRPAVVYCVDAGGGRRDVPRHLAQAIELAYEELGVTLVLDGVARLGAGSDQPPPVEPADQLTAQLIDRISATCVVTGTISYPDLGPGLPAAEGKIVVGKAVLTAETPFPVLAYASDHPDFPCDSVSDQWFDASQFDAYHSLGRHMGEFMGARMPLPDVDRSPVVPPSVIPSPRLRAAGPTHLAAEAS